MPMEPPDWEKIALLIPTTAPRLSRSGPPELPGLIDASVWTNSSYGPLPMKRSLALTIPVVTVWSSPNGLPIAITGSPTWSRSESPSGSTARVEASILSSARSVGGIGADDARRVLGAAGQAHDDVAAARHDVVVRHDVAVGRDDEAGAEARPGAAARRPALEEAAEELRARVRDVRLGADVDDGGPRRLGEIHPELVGGLERPVLRRVRPELGGGPARRVDVDPDRDDAAEHEEPTTRTTATIQVRRWVTLFILPDFVAPRPCWQPARRAWENAGGEETADDRWGQTPRALNAERAAGSGV